MPTIAMEPLPVKQVTWPQVILLLGLTTTLVGGIVLLSLNNKSVTDILAVAALVVIPILGGLGLQFGTQIQHKLDKVQETANGRLTAVMEQNEKLQAQVTALAMAVIPPPEIEPPK